MANLQFDHDIRKMSIKAVDGEIGHCVDLLFDERYWTTRYLVVKTGSWLFGEKVLIPIVSVDGINVDEGQVEVCLSKEEVSNAPDIDTDAPVSRRHEISIMDYYSYGYYWTGGVWGPGLDPMALRTPLDYPESTIPPEEDGDPYLRSVEEVQGYKVMTSDSETGSIEDIYVSPSDWCLTYLIVKYGGWFSKKETLLSPAWVKAVSWKGKSISTDLTKKQIEGAPEFEAPLDPVFEKKLLEYYQKAHSDTRQTA